MVTSESYSFCPVMVSPAVAPRPPDLEHRHQRDAKINARNWFMAVTIVIFCETLTAICVDRVKRAPRRQPLVAHTRRNNRMFPIYVLMTCGWTSLRRLKR